MKLSLLAESGKRDEFMLKCQPDMRYQNGALAPYRRSVMDADTLLAALKATAQDIPDGLEDTDEFGDPPLCIVTLQWHNLNEGRPNVGFLTFESGICQPYHHIGLGRVIFPEMGTALFGAIWPIKGLNMISDAPIIKAAFEKFINIIKRYGDLVDDTAGYQP